MRRRKRLVDVVRDETFLARKDEHLLAGPGRLPWRRLEQLRLAFRAAGSDDERREIALELERGLRQLGPAHYLGELQRDLARLGPAGSYERLARFAFRYFRHYAGPLAGKPFRFVGWQPPFLKEFLRRDRFGRRVYTVGLLMISKGCGKTPTAAVLGTEALVSETDAPRVYNVAGAKDQAGFCYEFARDNIEDGPLAAWLDVGNWRVRCPEHRGEYEVLASDGDLAAGINPSVFIVDEWWQFVHRKQRELYNSGVKAISSKRAGQGWALAITTSGFDKATQLGETYDAAIADPRTMRLNDGFLHVLRDEEAGFLFWAYGVPDDLYDEVDIEDPKVIRACNPVPFVSPRDLLKELHRHDTNELDWRRLHLGAWTKTRESWLPTGLWRQLESEAEVPRRGADVCIAIDGALKYDTTAVAWAGYLENGRIGLGARVWAARAEAPHHVYVPGGRLDNTLVEDFIVYEVAERYRIREITGDPRFLNELLPRLAARGFVTSEFQQNSGAMADAWQHFYESATARSLSWYDPERILPRHVDAAAAVLAERGWKVFKLQSWSPIDALVAAVMARARCAHYGPHGEQGAYGIDWGEAYEFGEEDDLLYGLDPAEIA